MKKKFKDVVFNLINKVLVLNIELKLECFLDLIN